MLSFSITLHPCPADKSLYWSFAWSTRVFTYRIEALEDNTFDPDTDVTPAAILDSDCSLTISTCCLMNSCIVFISCTSVVTDVIHVEAVIPSVKETISNLL